MSIERAEKLKKDLTDKWVTVDGNVPELRRFAGLSGKVKTVNMNCRVLVEFNGPADIGWYDIDPSFLRVIDAPLPKAAPVEKAEKPAAEKAAPKPAAGKSPLELARAQAAPKAGGPSPLELARAQAAKKDTAAPAAEAGKKLSPLELARQQDALKKAGGAAPAAAASAAPAPAAEGKKLSPLELARQQDAKKKAEAAAAATPEPAAAEPAVAAPAPEAKKPVSTIGPDGKKLSPLELARMQDAKKKG